MVKRFQPRGAKAVGPQVSVEDQGPRDPHPLLQAGDLIEGIPGLLLPAAQRGALVVPLDRLGQIADIPIALGQVKDAPSIIRLVLESALQESDVPLILVGPGTAILEMRYAQLRQLGFNFRSEE